MAGEIPQHISRTEQRLHKLQQFQSEVSQLQQWLTATRALLEAQHRPVSVTSVDQDDSIVVDPQVKLIDSFIWFINIVDFSFKHLQLPDGNILLAFSLLNIVEFTSWIIAGTGDIEC